MYVRQSSLFSFEELLNMEPRKHIELLFSALDLRPYAEKLRSSSPQGAKPIHREAILRALLASPLLGISTFTKLYERLDSDIRFRFQCGFRMDEPVPSIATISRVFSTLTRLNLAETLFNDLVDECRKEGIIDGSHLAIDSAGIHCYERKLPKLVSQLNGNADWGAKADSFGNKLTWFGYKIHLAVDTHSELPIALQVTPAHVYDGEMAIPLMEQIAARSWKFQFVMMDAGYDQVKNYEVSRSFGAQAIIPLNRRGEKEPPAGMSANGTPKCSMGFEMAYWGAETDRLKFRCPHVMGKVDCPLGAAWCSESNYGMVTKVKIADDARRYSNPHRGSRKWTLLYNERTAVERCNSRLKDYLTADAVHVGGLEKVTTHVYLNAIVLLAGALAANKANRLEQTA